MRQPGYRGARVGQHRVPGLDRIHQPDLDLGALALVVLTQGEARYVDFQHLQRHRLIATGDAAMLGQAVIRAHCAARYMTSTR